MKKHIGIYNDENAVREALRTGDLYKPYLTYTNGSVQYNPWSYVDANLDWQDRDTISIAYNDQNSHYFTLNVYTYMYVELASASTAITFNSSSVGSTAYTTNWGEYFTVAQNTSQEDRVLTFSFTFREEENGPVMYTLTYTINQSANNGAIIGWYVDGSISTDNISVEQSGGTAQIKIMNCSEWNVMNSNWEEIYSGTTDDVVTVSFAANELYQEVNHYYIINYSGIDGNGGQLWLTAVQEGLTAPSVDVTAGYQTQSNNYLIENSETAVTLSFSNMNGCIWEIYNDNSEMVASGDTDTTYEYPLASNSGTTPKEAFEISGQTSASIRYAVYDPNHENVVLEQYIQAYVLPANACLFTEWSPANTSPTTLNWQSDSIPVIMYNYDGNILIDDAFTSTAATFADDWSAESEPFDLGWRFVITTSTNLNDEQIPVTFEVTLGVDDQGTDDTTYSIDFEQIAYVAPEVYVPNQTFKDASGLRLIVPPTNRARVTVNNLIAGDEVYFSDDDGETWSQMDNNRYQVNFTPNQDTHPVMRIPMLGVQVIRDNNEILNEWVMVAQDTSSRPWIGWDGDVSNEITVPDGEAGYKFLEFADGYTFVTATTTGVGFEASKKGDELWLDVHDNETGNIIDGSITAVYEDGNQQQVSYTVTVHQDVPEEQEPEPEPEPEPGE